MFAVLTKRFQVYRKYGRMVHTNLKELTLFLCSSKLILRDSENCKFFMFFYVNTKKKKKTGYACLGRKIVRMVFFFCHFGYVEKKRIYVFNYCKINNFPLLFLVIFIVV